MIKKLINASLKEYSFEPNDYNKGYVMGLITMAYNSLTITFTEYGYFMEQVAKVAKISKSCSK